jgi:hypothetical protein
MMRKALNVRIRIQSSCRSHLQQVHDEAVGSQALHEAPLRSQTLRAAPPPLGKKVLRQTHAAAGGCCCCRIGCSCTW